MISVMIFCTIVVHAIHLMKSGSDNAAAVAVAAAVYGYKHTTASNGLYCTVSHGIDDLAV